jgi:hypothetical protein
MTRQPAFTDMTFTSPRSVVMHPGYEILFLRVTASKK